MKRDDLVRMIILSSLFLACLLIGWCIAVLLATVPSEVRLDDFPVNPLVFITLTSSVIMLIKMCPFSNCPRKTQLITIVTLTLYSILSYSIATETPEAVRFNLDVLSLLTVVICVISVLPFFGEKRLINFSKDNAELDSIFFATGVMWLSTLFSELFIWLKWYIEGIFGERISYMTLGGAGTKDILFRFGFWALVSMTLFHLLTKLYLKWKKEESVGYKL